LYLLGMLIFDREPGFSRRMRRLLKHYSVAGTPAVPAAEEESGSSLGGTGLMRGALSLADRVVQKEGRAEKLALLLDRAGVRLRPQEWLVIHGIAVIFGIVVFALLGHSLIIGFLLGAPIGALAPHALLKHKARRRQTLFLDRLPDSLQLVAGSLSAGYSLLQALDGLVQEGEEPVAGEIGRALASARLGIPIEDALEQVSERMSSPDFTWTTMAIRIQREVGGNLAEVLLTVAATLRERAALRRQVRALSAEGRLSAYILIAIPVLFGLYEMVFRRSYISVLWSSTIGIVLLGMTMIMMVVGTIWMRKVVNVEV
jgi:tight adherence protein B